MHHLVIQLLETLQARQLWMWGWVGNAAQWHNVLQNLGISWRLAGRTAISLDSIKGVLARMSTPRFSTTRPSKLNLWPSRVNDKGVSLTRAGEMSHLLGGRIGN